jgi:hypothetical protein
MRFANLPACPAVRQASDKLLLRVEEPTGTGVEVWCSRQGPGFAYEYRLRGSDGRTVRLDRCRLADGINAVGVDHSGTVSESPLEEGATLVKSAGRLFRFFHNNWDGQEGHHAIYDFRRQVLTTYASEVQPDALGRSIRLLTRAVSLPLGAIPQTDSPAGWGKLNAARSFDPARMACATASADDGMKIHEQEVDAYNEPGKLIKSIIAWPESSPIGSIEFDAPQRKLKLKFPPGARKTTVSLAFSRRLLGIGKEITKVRLDGQFIEAEENITATHRVVRFRIEEPAKEALLTESGGFPFFLVSSIAIVGGLIIGAVVALLFRRKLPAVADDEPPSET